MFYPTDAFMERPNGLERAAPDPYLLLRAVSNLPSGPNIPLYKMKRNMVSWENRRQLENRNSLMRFIILVVSFWSGVVRNTIICFRKVMKTEEMWSISKSPIVKLKIETSDWYGQQRFLGEEFAGQEDTGPINTMQGLPEERTWKTGLMGIKILCRASDETPRMSTWRHNLLIRKRTWCPKAELMKNYQDGDHCLAHLTSQTTSHHYIFSEHRTNIH